jgi:hypothetical protein
VRILKFKQERSGVIMGLSTIILSFLVVAMGVHSIGVPWWNSRRDYLQQNVRRSLFEAANKGNFQELLSQESERMIWDFLIDTNNNIRGLCGAVIEQTKKDKKLSLNHVSLALCAGRCSMFARNLSQVLPGQSEIQLYVTQQEYKQIKSGTCKLNDYDVHYFLKLLAVKQELVPYFLKIAQGYVEKENSKKKNRSMDDGDL